jgi:signal transduction histidine kinase
MRSLKKSLWLRFTIIVLLQAILTVTAVYFITMRNFKKSVVWDLNRLEKSLIAQWEEGRDWDEIVSYLSHINNDEETNYSFVVIANDKVVVKFGEGLNDIENQLKKYQSEEEWITYKSFILRKKTKFKEINIYTRAHVNLDLIDDTLWIFAVCLPLILLPVFYFGIKISKQIVNPLRRISKGLREVDEGHLEERIVNKSSHKEISNLTKALNRTLEKLESSFLLAKRFNANAAHELKTPLAIVRGEIEVCLQKERGVEDYEECLGKCLNEIFYLNKTIDVLLLISKPGYRDKVEFAETDVKQLVSSCQEVLEVIAAEKGVRISSELAELKMACEPSLLQRAIANLIDNAIKYSREDSLVHISLAVIGTEVTFTVKDSAEIIPEESKLQVFEPFFRLESEQTGSGIGLALVKWVAELHNGSIDIGNHKNGNIFTLRLPLISV